MMFSIITPTLERPSLMQCRESVTSQTFPSWEHIVEVDSPPTGDYGNHARHVAWERAKGAYVIYLDDDNTLAHPDALMHIACALAEANMPKVAIFPMLRHGRRFFNDPPGTCRSDTGNFVLSREIAQWPDGPEYTMDGIFIERLVRENGYTAFPNVPPIIDMPHSSEGK